MQVAPQQPSAPPSGPCARSPLVMDNRGSGDFSSQDGSHPSCSSTSSERNNSSGSGLGDGADQLSLLMDDDVRAILKKVKVNEGVLNKAIQSLGGGEKGLKSLMGYIMLWVKQQKERKSPDNPNARQSSLPALNFSMFGKGETSLQQNSDAFQVLNGIMHSPPAQVPVEQPDVEHLQRFKSRRLMMGEPGVDSGLRVDTGFYPGNFMSVAANPQDLSMYKSDITSPGMVGPCMPQLNYEHGMHGMQPVCNMQPGLPFTTAHVGMVPVEQTPAMATKAARRNRMARQRQSMMNQHHARAASQGCAAPVSVGGGLWNGAPPVGSMRRPGVSHSEAQPPQSVSVTAGRKGRNMDSLTLLLQKELRPSDVGNLGRIILPKKEAEQHMPFLAMRGGVSIHMEDFDTGHSWNLRYSVTPPPKMGSSPLVTPGTSSFWPNNKSRMYLLENTGEFVKSHRLVEGDLLLLYRNQQGGYVLRGKKKKSQRLDGDPVQVKFAHSSAKGFSEEPTLSKENGLLIQRLYGGGPPEKPVKEEPNLDDDPFLKDMMLSMGPSFGSDSSCLQPLERFPSLNLDFPLDEIMAVTTKTELEE